MSHYSGGRHLPAVARVLRTISTVSGRSFVMVVEGIDGSGKSTLARNLRKTLARDADLGVNVLEGDDRAVRKLYKILIAAPQTFPTTLQSVYLALADYASVIPTCEALPVAHVRILHRYTLSALTDAVALGMDFSYVRSLALPFPTPDITIFLDIDPHESQRRKLDDISLAESGGPYFRRKDESTRRSIRAIPKSGRRGVQKILRHWSRLRHRNRIGCESLTRESATLCS